MKESIYYLCIVVSRTIYDNLYCRVLKLADMPSCLGGGEFKINVV